MKRYFWVLTLFWSFATIAQDISGRLINDKGEAVAFATIQTGENTGVISNSEGFFTIPNKTASTSLTISCMGYKTKTVDLQDVKNSKIITLEEYVNELGSVYISDSKPNIDSIMARVRRNLSTNYNNNENTEFQLFYRGTNYITFGELDFTLDKASGMKKKNLAGANKSLDSLTQIIKETNAVHFKDYFANYKYKNAKEHKLDVLKATELIDKKKNVSAEQIQNKAQYLLLKHLDTSKTFKVKTGLFKVEDSLSFDDALVEIEERKTEYNIEGLKSETYNILDNSHIKEESIIMNLLDEKLYEFEYRDVTFFNDNHIYIIDFKPRRGKAKYSGSMYITDDNYALLRTDYAYAEGKRGKKFNLKLLLGVKYIENHRKGSILFDKGQDGYYYPQYITEEDGNYFYVNRPLKFIENSPQKNKLAMEFTIEGQTKQRSELLIVSNKALNESEYNSFKQKENIGYSRLDKYDPNIWKEFNSLEPLEEMKNFKVEE